MLIIQNKEITRTPLRNIYVKWNPLKRGKAKLNVDGAVHIWADGEANHGGIGEVFRIHNRKWIMGFMQSIKCTSPLEPERQALRKGLKIAIQHRISPLEVDMDAQEVINMFINENLKYENLLDECRYLMNNLGGVQLK